MPEWTPDQLTDSELIEPQAELERRLAVSSADSPRRRVLQAELDALHAEEKIRPQRRALPLNEQLTAIGEQLAASRVTELEPVTHQPPEWSPPRTVEELARTAYLLARWDGTPYLRLAERLDNLRIRLGASVTFDTDLLAWMVIVPGFRDGDPDEMVQTASMTELCDALDAMVTRRTMHVEEHTLQALAALAAFWALDFRIGYDKTNEECWADPVGGGPRLTAPTPEALNKLMADVICYPPPSAGPVTGPR